MKILFRSLTLVAALLMAACSSAPPAPDWQLNAHGAAQRAQQAWLSGDGKVAGSEWARSIEHESYGICIMPGEPQEMADAILRLHASTVSLDELGARARKYACEHASREQATRAYFDWIHPS